MPTLEILGMLQSNYVWTCRIAATEIPSTNRDRWLFAEWAEMDSWITQAMTSRQPASISEAAARD